ncbi:MAG: hypothetical protein JST85_22325 [Acidobacteria bacterium]|nr:hypothetical protein [Acidobacteriota bacterium]
MAKSQEKPEQEKEPKPKKEAKEKTGNALVGRVKKVLKKSRRKMGEEKFEKQLQRTIVFLEEMQRKLTEAGNSKADKKAKPEPKNNGKAKAKKAAKKAKPKSKAAAGSQTEVTTSK